MTDPRPHPFVTGMSLREPFRARLRMAVEDLAIWTVKWCVALLLVLGLFSLVLVDYLQTRALVRSVVVDINNGTLLQRLAQQQQEIQRRQQGAPKQP